MNAKRWNDRSTHRVQTNNAVEAMLRKSGVASWLETCGPTAATVACEVTGHPVDVLLPGGGALQPEDALALWMNDPNNVPVLASLVPDVDPAAYMDDEIIGFYPLALAKVFGVIDVKLLPSATWDQAVEAASSGKAVVIHLAKPRHYLCIVGYDDGFQELIYRDSWPARTGTDGYNLKMQRGEWKSNVQASLLIIGS